HRRPGSRRRIGIGRADIRPDGENDRHGTAAMTDERSWTPIGPIAGCSGRTRAAGPGWQPEYCPRISIESNALARKKPERPLGRGRLSPPRPVAYPGWVAPLARGIGS